MGRKTARTTATVSACAKRTLATACARQASSASADIASGWDLITLLAIRWRQHDLSFKAHCSCYRVDWRGVHGAAAAAVHQRVSVSLEPPPSGATDRSLFCSARVRQQSGVWLPLGLI